jgi:antitoxin VapB
MKVAKIFKRGNSQAVRLPKEFRFSDTEVWVKPSNGGVLLLPKTLEYERIIAAVNRFKGSVKRTQPKAQKRKWQ